MTSYSALRARTLPELDSLSMVESGEQRYVELGRAFLSLFGPRWRPARACHVRATRDLPTSAGTSAWAAIRATNRAPGPSLAGPGPGSCNKSPLWRRSPTTPEPPRPSLDARAPAE